MIKLKFQKLLSAPKGEMNLDLDIVIKEGSVTNLFGSSGAGKTSILRMIAGLMMPDTGRIIVKGKTWFDAEKHINLPPQERRVGLVFQDFALFPNMTVRQNLDYALVRNQTIKVIDELIEIIALGDLQNRKPDTLSGGQRQRVALARALVQQPDILLLDEPLSALDQKMRTELQSHIMNMHRRYGLSIILVSHDVSEILKMADEMIVLKEGNVTDKGRPADIFTNRKVSGKFQFTGEVISMEREGFLYIISILIANDLVKVIADEDEVKNLVIGDKVMVASKAFNPIIKKL